MTKEEVISQIQQWIVANGNRAITANILRPILLDMLEQPNELVGVLSALNTTDKTDLVSAINELSANSGSSFKVHTGTGLPEVTPPTSFSTGDFYLHNNGSFQGFYQYTSDSWVKVEKRKTSKVKEVFFGTVTTAGNDTTLAETVAKINADKFVQEENTITVLSFNVKVNGIPNVYASYLFKDNDITGEYGTGSVNGAVLSSQLVLNFKTTAVQELISNGTTIDIGNTGSVLIHDYLNNNLEPIVDEWKLDGSTLYFFSYTRDGQNYVDLYEGLQPADLGTDGDYVTVSTDFSTISVNGLPEGAATIAYVDGEIASVLTSAQNYASSAAGVAESNANNFSTAIKNDLETQLGNKVDKVTGKELSDRNFTQAEKDKLAGLESSRFKGTYVSEAALNTAHPTSTVGDYAHVDSGVGGKVEMWLWDGSDNVWRIAKGEGTEETSASIKTKYESNADTNAFTDALLAKLNSITAIFTTALKTAYDAAESWVSTNGANVLSHVTKFSNSVQDQIPVSQADGSIVWEAKPTGGGVGGTFSEERFTWATGNPNTFTVADSSKITDVYINGRRLDKFTQDGVTVDEWRVNNATQIEIMVTITDQDRINVISSSVATDAMDNRMASLVADLNTTEKDAIKSKLGIIAGGGAAAVAATDIKRIDINKVNALHASTPIITPTYDGSGQTTHPSLLYVPEGFNGWKYIMANTPYPLANNLYENPSIIVSNNPKKDGWQVPAGLTNPLVASPAGEDYNADTCVILGYDGKVYVYFHEFHLNGGTGIYETKIKVVSSTDLVTWSAPVTCLTTTAVSLVSVSIIMEDDKYIMYFINSQATPRKLERIESTLPDSGWTYTGVTVCTVANVHSLKDIWHIEVKKYHEEYHIFQCLSNLGTNGTATEIYFGSSQDGINFNTSDNKLLALESTAYINNRIYKGTGVLLNDHKYAFYYGVTSTSNEWRIAYTEVNLVDNTVSTTNEIYDLNANTINPETAYITENRTYQGKYKIAENLENAYLLTKLKYTGKKFSVLGEDGLPVAMHVKNDGTKVFVIGYTNRKLFEYTFGTKYDPKTLILTNTYSIPVLTKPIALYFSPDGTKFFIWDNAQKDIYQYNLSTAWNITSVTAIGNTNLFGTGSWGGQGLEAKPDGTRFYVQKDTEEVHEINLAIPFDVSSASIGNIKTLTEIGQGKGIRLSPDGKTLFACDSIGGLIRKFTLSVAWDITTATYSNEFIDVDTFVGGSLRDFCFANNGRIAFAIGDGGDTITSYK